eukprot:NODE_414_length_9102_cov_0.404754.p3 type:complete len:218 gc:universal NODE_414_length_9102_cov_0.404754:6865-6212(-)
MCLVPAPSQLHENRMTLALKKSSTEDPAEINESIDIEFEFFDISSADKESVEFHMDRLIPKSEEISNIVMRNEIGTLIKVDEEVLAIITAISTSKLPKDVIPIELMANDKSFLVIHERLVNMPWQTTVPMYRILLDDKRLKDKKNFIIFCKCDQHQVVKKLNKRAKVVSEYLHCEDEILFEDIKDKFYISHKKEGRLFGSISRSDLIKKINKIESMK